MEMRTNRRPTVESLMEVRSRHFRHVSLFSNAASGSSAASDSVKKPYDPFKNIFGKLSAEEQKTKDEHKKNLEAYIMVLRALAILLDSDVLELAMPEDTVICKLTNSYAHTSIEVRKLALEKLIKTDVAGIYPAKLRKEKHLDSSLPGYGLSVPTVEKAIRSLLDSFQMVYNSSPDDLFVGKLDAFINSKEAGSIPKSDANRISQKLKDNHTKIQSKVGEEKEVGMGMFEKGKGRA